jgi:PIN domain nuclease of toxin-antitoxin system
VDQEPDFSCGRIKVNLLLDTHILLWWLADDPRLPGRARKWIAQEAQILFVSVVSLWEISIKAGKGKLRADPAAIHKQIEHGDYTYLPVEPAHVLRLFRLPAHHADPFDRMLLAQAISEKLTLLTCDTPLRRYGESVLLA